MKGQEKKGAFAGSFFLVLSYGLKPASRLEDAAMSTPANPVKPAQFMRESLDP